ncbi:hypothetical protein [Segatella copri]|uniref:hypothetical protein n=1 Tax=Segatella copri TaxID=165179 RepID=UPI001C023867|nr:hypothetical protein [Segatella copri]MBT9635457.1 hypothetical protein [Segatella copri]
MVEKINIVEILKDKPQGTKLYSSACGKCKLEEVDDKSFKISFYNSKFGFMNGGEGYLDKNGKLYDDGECIIFPSKEMRDWSKFAWKKGDVLINSCGFQCIFKEWASDDYTKFNGCYSNSKDGYEDVSNAETAKFVKLDNNIAYGYVREIERKLGGILNLETLEIEKTQPEFKDGDIVVYGESVAICRRFYKHTLSFYISLNEMFGLLFADEVESSEEYRFATEEEKQQLFDALEKEGKAWDAEKKQIVDIKKEYQFKPFEKVLVRDSIDDVWRASFFSHIKENDGRYVTTCVTWKFCIPYIGNESLLGTTKYVEG